MAKEQSEAERAAKREKKEKKRKATDDVETGEKKKKKEKKRKSTEGEPLLAVDQDGDLVVEDAVTSELATAKEADGNLATVKIEVPLAALVPFAHPLCDEKAQKKVLKGVKKAAKNKALKRGVKEAIKAVRKSPIAPPTLQPSADNIPGIVVLAADISPMDVISHIPVLCEDHGIPYVYVPSRAELGAAGNTKRPTSVVLVTPKRGKGAEGEETEWKEAFDELYKVAMKLGQHIKV